MNAKRIILQTVLALFTIGLFAPAVFAKNNSPVGYWKTVDDKTKKKKSIVKIWVKNGVAYGKILGLFRKKGENQDPKCTKCKGKRKNQKTIGMTIIYGLKAKGKEWGGGKIIDPANGKVYKAKIWTVAGGNKLKVRGYVFLFFRTQTWIRISSKKAFSLLKKKTKKAAAKKVKAAVKAVVKKAAAVKKAAPAAKAPAKEAPKKAPATR